MTEVEFIGGPQCGRIQDVEQLSTEFYFAFIGPIHVGHVHEDSLIPPPIIQQKYVYRLCRRIKDDKICYWYIGIR